MFDTLTGPHGGTFVTTKATLAIVGGSVKTFTTAGTPAGPQTYCINGKAYTKAALTATAAPTLDVNTGIAPVALTANKGAVFLWALNAAGTVQIAQGSVEALDASGAFITAPQFPSLPDTSVAFGYQVIKAGATLAANWIFGVGLWDATGITLVTQDLMMVPARPQVS